MSTKVFAKVHMRVFVSIYSGMMPKSLLSLWWPSLAIFYWFVALHIVGTAHVALKDSILQASSPLRHVVELIPLIKEKDGYLAALLLFTNGGSNHNCKHLKVQTALLALFFMGGMDTMVLLRTAPQQSWTNPSERIMSVINLGLQGCSLGRTAMYGWQVRNDHAKVQRHE